VKAQDIIGIENIMVCYNRKIHISKVSLFFSHPKDGGKRLLDAGRPTNMVFHRKLEFANSKRNIELQKMLHFSSDQVWWWESYFMHTFLSSFF
jgi:hypothetical protein